MEIDARLMVRVGALLLLALPAARAAVFNPAFDVSVTAIMNVDSAASGNGSLTISGCTFSGNFADLGGDGIHNEGSQATTTIGNTILAGCRLGNDQGTITSAGYNLSDDDGAGFLTGTADQINKDPILDGRRDNGGPTETHAVRPGSPAIDRGKRNAIASLPLDLDQRGEPRPFDDPGMPAAAGGDNTDIGAYELNEATQAGPTFTVNTLEDHDNGLCGTRDCTLREALNAANAKADDSVVTFAPALRGTIQLSQPLGPIRYNLVLQGPGANLLTVNQNPPPSPPDSDFGIFTIGYGGAANPVVKISGLSLTNGRASAGGAILNANATLTVVSCTFSGNVAFTDASNEGGFGGAIYSYADGGAAILNVTGCTFSDNAAGQGSAIANEGRFNHKATATVTNCTFRRNYGDNGGAIAGLGSGSGESAIAIHSSTFSLNIAGSGGALFLDAQSNGNSSATVDNTIFQRGAAGDNLSVNNAATFSSAGHNLSSDAAGGNGTTGPAGYLNGSGDMRNTDPKLAAIGLYGGETPTLPLQPTSPAINKAVDAPALDQRNCARTGAADIGAFEFHGTPLRFDFNGDAYNDLLLTNAAGETAVWNLRRNALRAAILAPAVPAGWELVAAADFNLDGSLDYLLYNPSTRATSERFLRNYTSVGSAAGPNLLEGWQLITAIDMNLDKRPDLVLFKPDTRETAVRLSKGTSFGGMVAGPTLPTGFRLVDAVDFNGNGIPDFLTFKPSTRATQIRYLMGTTQVSNAAGPTLPSGWNLAGAADYTGDAKPDLVLFQPTTGRTSIWELNGTSLVKKAAGPTVPGGFHLAVP